MSLNTYNLIQKEI